MQRIERKLLKAIQHYEYALAKVALILTKSFWLLIILLRYYALLSCSISAATHQPPIVILPRLLNRNHN